MSEAQPRRLLIVANLTESTPQLLKEVERRAKAGCSVTLIVPPEHHPDAPDWWPEDAKDLVQRSRARPSGPGRRRRRRRGGDDRRRRPGQRGRLRRDHPVHAARAPPALAPSQPPGGDPEARDSRDRHRARRHRLVLRARLPGRLGANGGGTAYLTAGAHPDSGRPGPRRDRVRGGLRRRSAASTRRKLWIASHVSTIATAGRGRAVQEHARRDEEDRHDPPPRARRDSAGCAR